MITATDLAVELGLSQTAVSQILNGKGRFAPATRTRVLSLARERGYRLDVHARATRTRRADAIALLTITPAWKGGLYPGLFAGALDGATARGSTLLVATCTDASLSEIDQQPMVLRHQVCDGLLVNYHVPPPAGVREAVSAARIPALWLNLRMEANCVHPDDLGGGQLAARTLIGMGHRRLAYVSFSTAAGGGHYSAADRRDGAVAACAEHGLPLRELQPGRAQDERLSAIHALLSRPDRPDAIIAYSPREALAVMMVASQLGLRLPQDLSLLMIHDEAEVEGLPIDAALLPLAGVGRTAAGMLLDAINGDGGGMPATAVPFGISIGRTVARRQ